MPRIPVDTAFSVVMGPLVDDTDFTTLETNVSAAAAGVDFDIIYNAPGTEAPTTVSITPSTAASTQGWTHITQARYALEITAAQNDTKGHFQVVGFFTGVLPFESPIYEVVSQAEYAHSVEGGRFLDEGTLVSAASTTAELASTAVGTADYYNDALLVPYLGTGLKQGRVITDYSAGKVATVDAWATIPTGAKYYVLPLGLSGMTATEVNAEVVDALATDTYAEPGQELPAATSSLANKINYLYKAWRNRSNQTATTYQLFADDATTVDQKATVSDDATTAEKGEIATGP